MIGKGDGREYSRVKSREFVKMSKQIQGHREEKLRGTLVECDEKSTTTHRQ